VELVNDLVPAGGALPAPRGLPVHDAVREQLAEDIGAERLRRLSDVLDDLTFSVVLHWLSSGRRASRDTKHGYANDIAAFAEWAAQHRGTAPVSVLTEVDGMTISVWTVYARSQGWSVRTQRRTLSAVSSLFNYAAKHGVPVANPVDFEEHAQPVGTSSNGRPVGATRALTLAEVAAIREACDSAEEHVVFDLLYLQGLRESEVVGLRVEHIERDRTPVLVRVQRKRGLWVEREIGGDAARWLAALVDGRTEGPVCVDPAAGEGRNRFQIIDITRRLARRAGVPSPTKVTPHVLRATAITVLLDEGIPLQEVQAWAGHASSKTTQGYWERANSARRDGALTSALATATDKAAAGIQKRTTR
jgi:integrase/recombinase XerD